MAFFKSLAFGFKRQLIWILFFGLLLSCKTNYTTQGYDTRNISIDVLTDSLYDENYEAMLLPYRQQIETKMSEVIGVSPQGMESYRPESPLSNFLSDLILDYALKYCRTNQLDIKTSFSLFNHGGIRTTLPKGNVLVSNAYQIMPFENELVLLELSGSKVLELADYIAGRNGEGVGGITFGIADSKAVNVKINGADVDPTMGYWLVTSDYIANGGDGMSMLKSAQKRIETGEKIRDVMILRFRQMYINNEPLHATKDGRIKHVE